MLVISDLHWRCDTPAWRKEENYSRAVLRPQLAACLALGEPVVVCGDVFHRSADFAATYDLFCFLTEHNAVLYAVRGQHDMIDHADAQEETGFNLLVKAGLIIVLVNAGATYMENVSLAGQGWNEPVPALGNTLIAHVSISHGAAVIPGATSATAWARGQTQFGLKFTGDNHIRFSLPEYGLYNAGCFHQMTADLEDQAPAGWHVSRGGVVTLWPIPYTPALVNLSRRTEEKGKAVAGIEFITALTEARQHGGSDVFLAALIEAAETLPPGVGDMLKAIIKKCKEQ